MDARQLEEGSQLQLDFTRFKSRSGVGVVPVCVQDADTRDVLLIGFASAEALEYSQKHGIAAFWSFSRDELWVKGKTSGNALAIAEIRVNCEQNSLLYLVRTTAGGACHTKSADGTYRHSCYYRRIIAHDHLASPSIPDARRRAGFLIQARNSVRVARIWSAGIAQNLD